MSFELGTSGLLIAVITGRCAKNTIPVVAYDFTVSYLPIVRPLMFANLYNAGDRSFQAHYYH